MLFTLIITSMAAFNALCVPLLLERQIVSHPSTLPVKLAGHSLDLYNTTTPFHPAYSQIDLATLSEDMPDTEFCMDGVRQLLLPPQGGVFDKLNLHESELLLFRLHRYSTSEGDENNGFMGNQLFGEVSQWCGSMKPLSDNLRKHAAEISKMSDPEHMTLIPLVESALAIMRLSCEKYFVLVSVFVSYILFRDPPTAARIIIRINSRLSKAFQKVILYSFPAVCWIYGAGFIFSTFVSVVFWGGPVISFYESLHTAISIVRIKALRSANAVEIERMGGNCAICWGDMTEGRCEASATSPTPTEPPGTQAAAGAGAVDSAASSEPGPSTAGEKAAAAGPGLTARASTKENLGGETSTERTASAAMQDMVGAAEASASGEQIPRDGALGVSGVQLAEDPHTSSSVKWRFPGQDITKGKISLDGSAKEGAAAMQLPEPLSQVAAADHGPASASTSARSPNSLSVDANSSPFSASHNVNTDAALDPPNATQIEGSQANTTDPQQRDRTEAVAGPTGDFAQGPGQAGAAGAADADAAPQPPLNPALSSALSSGSHTAANAARGYSLPCGHAYHHTCLTQWLHQCHAQGVAPTCPMCQVDIKLEVKWRFPYPWHPPANQLGINGAEPPPVPPPERDGARVQRRRNRPQAGLQIIGMLEHQRELQDLLLDMPHIPGAQDLLPHPDEAEDERDDPPVIDMGPDEVLDVPPLILPAQPPVGMIGFGGERLVVGQDAIAPAVPEPPPPGPAPTAPEEGGATSGADDIPAASGGAGPQERGTDTPPAASGSADVPTRGVSGGGNGVGTWVGPSRSSGNADERAEEAGSAGGSAAHLDGLLAEKQRLQDSLSAQKETLRQMQEAQRVALREERELQQQHKHLVHRLKKLQGKGGGGGSGGGGAGASLTAGASTSASRANLALTVPAAVLQGRYATGNRVPLAFALDADYMHTLDQGTVSSSSPSSGMPGLIPFTPPPGFQRGASLELGTSKEGSPPSAGKHASSPASNLLPATEQPNSATTSKSSPLVAQTPGEGEAPGVDQEPRAGNTGAAAAAAPAGPVQNNPTAANHGHRRKFSMFKRKQ
eukprot:gene23003-30195_t